MRRFFCVAGMLLALQAAQATELYRWVDKSGKVHYGDMPPDDDAERLRISAQPARPDSAPGDANVSYEARQAMKNFPVTLYVSKDCGEACEQARAYLRQRRVPFTQNMLKTQDEFDAFKKQTGIDGVPALSIGRTWLRGFQAKRWADELDAAGYPK